MDGDEQRAEGELALRGIMVKSTGDHGSFNKKYFISKGEIIMKKNKGFSMVELIIVIAIMAILAGALAPALIKYINKSRISTDIQTANTIATAVQTALSNEAGFDAAPSATWTSVSSNWTNTDSFWKPTVSTIGGSNAPTVKAKKCVGTGVSGNNMGGDFEIYVDTANNEVKVRENTGNHLLYPTADACLTDDSVAHSATGN